MHADVCRYIIMLTGTARLFCVQTLMHGCKHQIGNSTHYNACMTGCGRQMGPCKLQQSSRCGVTGACTHTRSKQCPCHQQYHLSGASLQQHHHHHQPHVWLAGKGVQSQGACGCAAAAECCVKHTNNWWHNAMGAPQCACGCCLLMHQHPAATGARHPASAAPLLWCTHVAFCMHMQNAAACYHSHSLACAMQATLPEGSLLFSYVTTDDACEAYQLDRAVTTSTGERRNRLLHRLLHESRERRKVRHTFMIDAVHGKAGGATTGAATPRTQRTRLHIPIICLSSAATRSCCHCCCRCC
jgi:hypothetical protein